MRGTQEGWCLHNRLVILCYPTPQQIRLGICLPLFLTVITFGFVQSQKKLFFFNNSLAELYVAVFWLKQRKKAYKKGIKFTVSTGMKCRISGP